MLDSLFNPIGVAVIGASSKDLHIGNRIIKNLLKFGYKKGIYPINPKSDKIHGLKVYKSILQVPHSVDLVHIVIPSKFVVSVIRECSKKGVKNIIINSGGFSETGEEGLKIQKSIVEVASKYGIRILGPNCQGIINTDENIRAYCNFTFTFPESGNVSIVASSGGVAELIHNRLVSSGIGTRLYASNGNACDISVLEIIEYFGEDEATKVIIIYLETLENLQDFIIIAKKIVFKKPILVMKSARTEAGKKAAISHTGGLINKDVTTNLVLKEAGVLEFTNEGEMVNGAMLLSYQPLPKGNRVGLITNTGGPAIIATDVLVENGFVLSKLSEYSTETLKNNLHLGASLLNPVDVLATGTAEHFGCCLDVMMGDENVDIIFITFVTPFFVDSDKIALEISKYSFKKIKPIVCNLITDFKVWFNTVKILKDSKVPFFELPTDTAYSLRVFNKYRKILGQKKEGDYLFENFNLDPISLIFESSKKNKNSYLLAEETYNILSKSGFKVPSWNVAYDFEGVLKIVDEIGGYPIVLKIDSEELIHKSDSGGVVLNLKNDEEVFRSIESISFLRKKYGNKLLVQKYIPGERELIFGAKFEKDLGYIIMFGIGGVFVELLQDVVFGLAPISNKKALDMVQSLKSIKIFSGFRNMEKVKLEVFVNLIQRLSLFVTTFNQIKEIDFNPVKVLKDQLLILDARIILK